MMRFLLALLLCAPWAAQAQYPDRPIRVVVVFGPGGGADTTLRLMAGPMSQVLGQQVQAELHLTLRGLHNIGFRVRRR